MSKELKNITESVMDQIHENKIKMRPKIYFIVGSILTFIGFVFSTVVSIFLVGLISFVLRSHGGMASYKLDKMISNFPWWAIALAIISLTLGIWLLHKYDFSFKVNFKLVIVSFILAVIAGGFIIDMLGLNNVLTRRGPMQGMMRRYNPSWNITENKYNLAEELKDCLPKSDTRSHEKCNELLKQITDYNSCVKAGFSIMKSNPPQCATPDGRTFKSF